MALRLGYVNILQDAAGLVGHFTHLEIFAAFIDREQISDQFPGYRQSRPVAVTLLQFPLMQGSQLRVPLRRDLRRLDQHFLQVFVAE